MANIVKRNGGEALERTEPMRAMREMMRDVMGWDPFREMAPLWRTTPGTFQPSFDVRETADAYVFEADIPGIKPEDIEVTVTGNRLQVTGHREETKETQGETYFCSERSFGAFSRSFTLPDGADPDNARSEIKNGILTLMLPKKPEAQPRRIAIGSGAGKTKAS